MNKPTFSILFLAGLLFGSSEQASAKEILFYAAVTPFNDSTIVYQSENLVIQKLSDHVYQHISFLTTNTFGRVNCNGMVVVNNKEAIVFDTPADSISSEELITYFSNQSDCTIKAVVPTHFHEDCVGGLESFYKKNIPAYASSKTIALLQTGENALPPGIHAFENSIEFVIGGKKVYAEYFGEGHTKDNVIGYFPEDHAVFGGCLIKEMNATKGFLGDANIGAWPTTVTKLKQKYPGIKIVIPGHGKSGGTELFDYTIKLFQSL